MPGQTEENHDLTVGIDGVLARLKSGTFQIQV